MRISRIFTEQPLGEGITITLDKAASSYLVKVLRLKEDNEVRLFNGIAVNNDHGYFKSRMSSVGKQVEITAEQFVIDNNQSPLQIVLLQGVSKGDHMDTTIQKAVELGVTKIIPVICERTVVNLKADRLDKKMNHWQGVIISACEQSGRNQLPEIEPPIQFNDITLDTEAGFILQPESTHSLQDQDHIQSASILIGPEGGFNEKEIQLATVTGFTPVKFGPRILRTETAAIAAISILQSSWGDLN